jgi:hypothetical protein
MASGDSEPPQRPRFFARLKKTLKKGSSSRQTVQTQDEDVEVPRLDFPDAISTYEHLPLCTPRETHVTHYLGSVEVTSKAIII